jgi:DNA-directed RNA polymerase specialized sigma subunit
VSNEEAKRVYDALDAVEAIPDPVARARVMSTVMADQVKRNKRWTEERRQLVLELRAQDMSLRKIAAEVGISLGSVQDILRGYTRPWSSRPKKDAADAPTSEDPA